jgi:uncharacterized caspase-like protein
MRNILTPWVRPLLLATALAVLPAASRADDAKPLRGVALVIGEGDYASLQKLDNPKRDARAMDDMLDSLGFTVDRIVNGDAKRLRQEIDDFVDEAKGADVALIYYSGHGIEAGGSDFLVPIDTDLSSPETAGQSLVPVDDLLDRLARTVPVTIALLDACRTNSFPAGQLVVLPGTTDPVAVAPTGLEAMRGPVPVATAKAPPDSLGMVIGFAASPGQPAMDGEPGGDSPYASALLEHFAAGGYSLGDLMTLVSEEVYLKTRARQLPWTNSSLRRVLSFGAPAPQPAGDEGDILNGRRQLLLTIAQQSADTQRYVETVATEQGVPLDALYGMLKVLGVDTSDQGDLEKQLRDSAQKLKDFMAERPDAAVTDPELKRLAALADEAEAQGTLDLALKFRAQASARADELSQSLDRTEADLKASRLELGETYNAHAQAADLNLDFETAATMWGKAYEQAAKWDDATAVTYKWRQGNALAELAVHRNDQDAFAASIEAYQMAEQISSISPLTKAHIETSIADVKTELGESAADMGTMQEAVTAYRAALELYKTQGAPDQAWARVELGLASALVYLGDREQGTDSLDDALGAINDALSVTDKGVHPLEWAQAESTLGNVLRMIGDHTGDAAQYEKSAEAQRQAVAALDRNKTPLDWATAEANLGASLARIGEGEDGTDAINAAIDAFEAALDARPRDKVPAEWAAVQDDLGGVYSTRGGKTKRADDYDQGIAAFKAALEVRTKASAPHDWAETTRNLAVAQKQLATLTGDGASLDQAIENYQAALTVYTRENAPMDWAQTEADLGIAALARADRTHSKADLRLARNAYAAALEIYGSLGADYAGYFNGKLRDIDRQLKR